MRLEFQPHNLFYNNIKSYLENDPNLNNLKNLKYVFNSQLLDEIPLNIPGIYILTGGRQVGKTTLIKLFIKKLLVQGKITPNQIFFLPCDILNTYQDLVYEIEQFVAQIKKEKHFYLFIDEITYVKEWDRAIKHFADLGYFKQGSVLITGSDSIILKEGMKRFPGRRGEAEQSDFHYFPISFSEYVILIEPALKKDVNNIKDLSQDISKLSHQGMSIFEEFLQHEKMTIFIKLFNQYLITGGFLTALNELAKNKKIKNYVYNTYIQWIIGDFLKKEKKEYFLKDIVLALSERLGNQISFHNLTAFTNIQNHSTTHEYLKILEDMDVLFIQEALREDKLRASPKKLKKINFSDPFIALALICWAKDIQSNWDFVNENIIMENKLKPHIVEGCISSLFKRKYKTYYIKAQGEVDLALLNKNTFFPIEIKWTENLKTSELKQILKYKKGLIGYKGRQIGKYEHLDVLPLPLLALFI